MAAVSLDAEQRQDFTRGLEIIESRAGSLTRFVEAYRHLAQLPPPTLRPTPLAPLLKRVAALEIGLAVRVVPGPDVILDIDPDQIEQLLINLVRNAAEAALGAVQMRSSPAGAMGASAPAVASGSVLSPDPINDSETPAVPEVCLRWDADSTHVVIVVEDNGRGIANLANAFVPFYTTKPEGSGIGLVLSRQIAEGHGGRLEIRNRDDQPGCRVLVVLPRSKSKLVAEDV